MRRKETNAPQNFGRQIFRARRTRKWMKKVSLSNIWTTFFNNLSFSDRQFRFKKLSDCNKAINFVKNTFHVFNANGNTVNLVLLKSKAFDKDNWWGIFAPFPEKKLVNCHIIDVMEFWFSISFPQVKWNDSLSDSVRLQSGVPGQAGRHPFPSFIFRAYWR